MGPSADGPITVLGSSAPRASPHRNNLPAVQSVCLHNSHLETVQSHLKSEKFFWLDLEDPTDDEIHRLGRLLDLHPLTVEDAKTFGERPKLEEYPGYAYLIIYGAESGEKLNEIHLIISSRCIVTIHKATLTELKELRDRYDGQEMRSHQMLIYRILDAVTETYFPVLAQIDEEIDEIEDTVIQDPTEESLRRIFALKRQLVAMRRVVTPVRDAFARNAERISELPGMQTDDRLYFRDLYDTMIRISDLVDSYRDLLSGATDLHLSTVANRQGEINKQLTIIATIFLPLTFLTGFFGMNFAFMTNHITSATWSFFVLGLGLLVVSVVVLAFFFRSRRWL
jgi:magnesium transporter